MRFHDGLAPAFSNRRRRIAAPVRPKPPIINTQLAGSWTLAADNRTWSKPPWTPAKPVQSRWRERIAEADRGTGHYASPMAFEQKLACQPNQRGYKVIVNGFPAYGQGHLP
jgi:hypothetical protein